MYSTCTRTHVFIYVNNNYARNSRGIYVFTYKTYSRETARNIQTVNKILISHKNCMDIRVLLNLFDENRRKENPYTLLFILES